MMLGSLGLRFEVHDKDRNDKHPWECHYLCSKTSSSTIAAFIP